MKQRILPVALYIVFLVVLFEGTARLAFLVPQVSRRLLVDSELTWRRSWVSRHKKTGKEIYYRFDIYDPTKGWISKPNLKDRKVFNDKVLNTNSKGFRGRTEHPHGKVQDKVRILVLGDSFTFGDKVSDNEIYPHYLQEMIPHAEVINLGVHGYGHDQMLILLEEEGLKYEPDIVILGFLPMDMSRNLLNFRDYAKPKFVFENNQLRLTGSPVPTPEETLKWDWARPRIVDMVSFVRHRSRQLSGSYAKDKEEITTAILTEMIKLADSVQAVPLFVYLPTGNQISLQSLTPGEEYLFAFCEANDRVRCFSARPRFAEKMTQGVVFKKRGHWGPAGHLAAAEAIKRYLVDEGLT